ncbi:TIGR02680 family protein [Robertmurraya sp. FSL R5-0851]|uniref:TIGR02680 family protein n=1 Tax=Robertmurraya sp. FSL R5-0851 TaxID=2921584 RepID=UPI0030FBFA85
MENNHKWLINKTGILNYWYFDEEEFPFENGHLLIRGGNGSGKSVTTQSFLPLLLDGNKSPQRLDPFGTRSRKMIDYIFGESSEENEKTSYLYMEYKRKDAEEYITTGIGLKGNLNNDKVDSWYFLIKNKRINEDIKLFQYQLDTVGQKVKVPLSEKELKNLIEREKCGYLVTTQAEYAELVNKYIFQFESIQEFKEMVDLIVRIRAPKLSNNMGPNVLYEMLQSSLPELSTNDLRSLSETIQNMDEIKSRLAKAEQDLKLIKNLSAKYNDYNFAVLSQKANMFLSMKAKRDASKKGVDKAQKAWKKATETSGLKQKEVEQLGNELESLIKKVEHLKDNDVYKMKKELIALETRLEEAAKEWGKLKNSLDEKVAHLRKLEGNLKDKNDEKYGLENKINIAVEELDAIAEDVEYPAHSLNRDYFKTALNERKALEAINQWEVSSETFQTLVGNILGELEKEKRVEEELDQQKLGLLKEEKERDGIRKAIDEKRDELERQLEQLNRLILEKNEQNKEFVLSKDELSLVAYSILGLFDTTSVKEIERQLAGILHSKRQTLGKKELQIDNKLELIGREIKDKHGKIDEWEKKEESIPAFRKVETETMRKSLAKKGIPFISFYEAVEFIDGLNPYEKERLESALIEMGILDSLIVSPAYLHLVNDSDAVLIPKPLSEGETLKEYLTVNLPKEAKDLEQMTNDILASISIVEHENQSYVTTFGNYQHGVVKGNAIPRENSIYIGKEARKLHRERMLHQLREELIVLESQKTESEFELQQLKERGQMLQIEADQYITFDEVEEINVTIDSYDRELIILEKTITHLKERISDLHKTYIEVKRKRMELTEGRETPLTIEAYSVVNRDVKEYLSELRGMKQTVNDWNTVLQNMEILEEQKEREEDDIAQSRDLTLQKEKEVDRTKVKVNELRKTIAEKDIGNIEEQIEQTERRIQEIPQYRDELNKEVGHLEGQIPLLKNNILLEEASVRFYQEAYDWSKEIFVQEVNRKLVETYDRDVLTVDEDMVALAEAAIEDDKEISRENVQGIRDKMVAVFNEVRVQGLEEYSLTLSDTDSYFKEISDEGYELFSHELEKIESVSARQLIHLTSDGKLVSPQKLQQIIEQQVQAIKIALTEEDERLYKEVILDNIGERIRELISQAARWKEEINEYMMQTNASNGLKLWLQWKPRKATEDGEMSTSDLVRLLQKDPDTLKESDYKRLSKHFNSKIKFAKESYESDDALRDKSFDVLIKEILDYREWFEFKIYFQKEGEDRKELTKTNYNTLSGGERAMSMYIPLLSALYSKFISASDEAPYIISMDEAFAGVDENNIATMFKLMNDFGLNYILNSQALWGTYETVDALSIAEIIRPQNAKNVTVMLYKWNGIELNTVKEEVHIKPTQEQQNLFDVLESMEV